MGLRLTWSDLFLGVVVRMRTQCITFACFVVWLTCFAAAAPCVQPTPAATCAAGAVTRVCSGTDSTCCSGAEGVECGPAPPLAPMIPASNLSQLCAAAGERVVCQSGSSVVEVSFGPTVCVRCSANAHRLLEDTCEWRPTCVTGEVARGICHRCSTQSEVLCCASLPGGCAPTTQWHSTATVTQCPERNALLGACSAGCRACINPAYPAVVPQQLCGGRFVLEDSVAEQCGTFARCPAQHVVVGFGSCGTSSTSIACAKVRSGVVEDQCVERASDGEVVCPTGYAVVALCASAVAGGCSGSATRALCCYVSRPYPLQSCAVDAEWTPVLGDAFHPNCATPDRGGDLPTISLFNVTSLAYDRWNRQLYFGMPGGLWKAPTEQFFATAVSKQTLDVGEEGPTGIVVRNQNTLTVVEGQRSIMSSAVVGASGLVWIKTVVVGIDSPPTSRTSVLDGGPLQQHVDPVYHIATRPAPSQTFIAIGNGVWLVGTTTLVRYTGDGGTVASDSVPRLQAEYRGVSALAATRTHLIIADAVTHTIRAVHFGRQAAVRVMGVFHTPGATACSPTVALRSVRLNAPRGLAVWEDDVVFIADSANFCVRRVANVEAGTGCVDVGTTCGSQRLNVAFVPIAIAASSTRLYVASVNSSAVMGYVLRDPVDQGHSRTLSPQLSPSRSLSPSRGSPSASATAAETTSTSQTGSASKSISTCANIIPKAVAVDEAYVELAGMVVLPSRILQYGSLNVSFTLLTCHRFVTPLVAPRLRLNPRAHRRGEGASIFGIQHLANASAFVTAELDQRAPLPTVVVTFGPDLSYQPTIDEVVDVVWPPEAFEYAPRTEMIVTLRFSPKREQVFDPTFRTAISFAAAGSLMTSFVVLSPLTAIRSGRLEHIARISECPLEDVPERLPFSVSPVGLSVGTGNYRYHIGAVFFNLAVVFLAIALPLMAASLLFVGLRLPSFDHALRLVRFPSIVTAPVVLLLMPTLTSSLKVLWFGQQRAVEHGERTMSSFAVLCTAFLVVVSAVVLTFRFGAVPTTNKSHSTLELVVRGKWQWMNDGKPNEGFVEKMGAAFAETGPSRHWYFLVELIFTVCFASVDAPSLSTREACRVFQLVAAALFMTYAIMLFLLRPFQSKSKMRLLAAAAVFEFCGVTAGTLFLSQAMSVIAMVFISLSAACLVAVAVLHGVQLVVVHLTTLKRWWFGEPEPTVAAVQQTAEQLMHQAVEDAKREASAQRAAKRPTAPQQLHDVFSVPMLSTNPLDYERPDKVPITPKPPRRKFRHLPGYESSDEEEKALNAAIADRIAQQAQKQAEMDAEAVRDAEIMALI